MKVKYIEKGPGFNFVRHGDIEKTVTLYRAWKTGGLLYGYKDQFNIISIALEDIIEIY